MTLRTLLLAAVIGLLPGATPHGFAEALPDHDILPPLSRTVAADEIVDVSLVPGVDAIVPGEPFLMGVRFAIDRPWHIYWKNPGDAGVATKLQWDLPEGFTVSEPRFPVPDRFMQPGDLVGYGYEQETVLFAEVRPPSALVIGTEVSIGVQATFLRCTDVCVPGKANVTIALPVAAASRTQAWLGAWQAEMAVQAHDQLRSLTVQSAAEPSRWVVKAMFDDRARAGSAEWFPAPPKGLVIDDLKQWTEGNLAVLSFAVGGKVPPEPEIPLLVAFTDRAGRRVGVEQVASASGESRPRE